MIFSVIKFIPKTLWMRFPASKTKSKTFLIEFSVKKHQFVELYDEFSKKSYKKGNRNAVFQE